MVSPERIFELDTSVEPHAEPHLLVPWSSRGKVFLSNLRDLLFPRALPKLVISSAPGVFWKDVFVDLRIAKRFIIDSYALHALVVLVVYFAFTSALFQNQRLPARDPYAHTTLEYYSVSEYLPPIRTAPRLPTHTVKGEPAYAKQEIISVPPEPDNSHQTIVTPDTRLIARDVPLPNVMAWASDVDPIQPLTASADLNTHPKLFTPPDIIAPAPEQLPRSRRDLQFQQAAIQPSPENLPNSRRKTPALEADIVKPAPELPNGPRTKAISPIQPAVVEPPPTTDSLKRTRGEMNVAKLAPSVSEPKLPVREQHAAMESNGGGARGGATGAQAQPQPPPPPPSAQGLGRSHGSGQLIALSAQPAPVLGPIEIPKGSRHGVFAAGPNGTLGAPATPTISAKNDPPGIVDTAGSTANASHVPDGLYVGPGPAAPTSGTVVAATPPPVPPRADPSLRDKLLGLMRGASADVSHAPPPVAKPKPDGDTKIEDKVFGDKRYYSMILNMPNLNSSVGSWIVRFAELKPTQEQVELSAPVALNKVDPAYPAELIRDQVEGTVVLYAVIRSSGVVDSVRVLRSVDDRLDKSAITALQRWHFRPGTKKGIPVDIEAVVQIPFRVAKLKY